MLFSFCVFVILFLLFKQAKTDLIFLRFVIYSVEFNGNGCYETGTQSQPFEVGRIFFSTIISEQKREEKLANKQLIEMKIMKIMHDSFPSGLSLRFVNKK